MPFIPRDPRQYRPGNPGDEWLNQIRSGGRITGSLPLLEATGSFAGRMKAPSMPTPATMQPSASRPGTRQTTPSVRSVIASLRPSDGGSSEDPNWLAKTDMSDLRQWNEDYQEQDRTDVGDGGGGIKGYLTGPGIGQAMISAGGEMMEAAGKPGANFGGSLGSGLKGFVAERARFQTSEAARRRADQVAGLGPTPQDLTARRNAIRARYEMRGFTDPIRLQQLLAMAGDEDGYKAALVELEAPEEAGQTYGEAEQEKLAWYLGLSPEDRASYKEWKGSSGGTSVTIEGDTPVGPAQEGLDAYIQGVYNGRSTTFDNVIPALQNVDQTLSLVNHPRFAEVAGVWSGNPIADALLRFEGDPELLAMLGTFERLGSDRALAILRNFTGAKSNFEFQVSEKMAAKDRSMSPAELRAMLELMRRAYIQEAVRWAQSMAYMGEDVKIEGDYAAVQRRFMSDAQGLLDQYGEEERSWRQAVDHLGIGRGRESE